MSLRQSDAASISLECVVTRNHRLGGLNSINFSHCGGLESEISVPAWLGSGWDHLDSFAGQGWGAEDREEDREEEKKYFILHEH